MGRDKDADGREQYQTVCYRSVAWFHDLESTFVVSMPGTNLECWREQIANP